jgi:hypothetical protein
MHEDVWNITYFHRAIQKRIGETLSAGYDLSQPLPDKMRTLLDRLDNQIRTASSIASVRPQRPIAGSGAPMPTVRAATLRKF